MTKADNADARVHRQYYPNGQVQRDSLYTQTLERDTTALHKYGLEYVYDRNGRQKTVKHPVQLSPAPGYETISQYDPITGALLRVSDPIGYTFTYGYDARNQTISFAMPRSFNERYTYDQDGNLLTQWSGDAAALHNVTMTYDRVRAADLPTRDPTTSSFRSLATVPARYRRSMTPSSTTRWAISRRRIMPTRVCCESTTPTVNFDRRLFASERSPPVLLTTPTSTSPVTSTTLTGAIRCSTIRLSS